MQKIILMLTAMIVIPVIISQFFSWGRKLRRVCALITLFYLMFNYDIGKYKNVLNAADLMGEEAEASSMDMVMGSYANLDMNAYTPVACSGADCSSYLTNSKGKEYLPSMACDYDTETSWQEGVSGNGEGEYICFFFDSSVKIDEIVIFNGNQKSESAYTENGRMAGFTISVNSNFKEWNLYCNDSLEPQVIDCNGVEGITEVKIQINEVYSGSKYEDTCIADVMFLSKNN